MAWSSVYRVHAYNVNTLRRAPLLEVSGALGDMGTLLPILIALAVKDCISLSSTLVFTGLANILTGITFGIPLPVQPMKAISAVAIARSFTRVETASAGMFVAAVVLVFTVTGLLKWFTHVIPIPVIKGIQVGAGLSLILSAGSSILENLGWISPNWADNLLWAIAAFLLLLATNFLPRFPYALALVVLGVTVAMLRLLAAKHQEMLYFDIWHPSILVPSTHDFYVGAIDAGFGQLPLTTLNSIIAVAHLSADLIPTVPAPSNTELGFSVAAMNLIGCWFGAMPVCHGSGGLAAQYRFGARSGASIILLGCFKLVLGIVCGESLVNILKRFPNALLGVMVLAAGLELAKVGESINTDARDLQEGFGGDDLQDSGVHVERPAGRRVRDLDAAERQRRWTVMSMTVGGLLAFRNDAVGFMAGMLCHWSFEAPQWLRKLMRSRELRLSSNAEAEHQRLL